MDLCRVRILKFARNLKFATSKTLVNFMKKMMFLSQNWYFSVQKALIYYTLNKSHHNSFILLVFSHVANFRYVANFTFLTLLMCRRCLLKYLLTFHAMTNCPWRCFFHNEDSHTFTRFIFFLIRVQYLYLVW